MAAAIAFIIALVGNNLLPVVLIGLVAALCVIQVVIDLSQQKT